MRMGSYIVTYYRKDDVLDTMTIQAEDDIAAEEDVRKKLTAAYPDMEEDDWLIEEVKPVRPSEEEAEKAIYEFLCEVMGKDEVDASSFEMHPDGSGWQFWVREKDTTSYVHHNLGVEWYGTGWTWADSDNEEAPDTETTLEAAPV